MTITMEQAEGLFRSPIFAGRVAEEIDIQAAETLADLDALIGAVNEVRERLLLGRLDSTARADIAEDMLTAAGRVADFAIAVAA